MDDVRNNLQSALKDAMKNKETLRRDVIRMTLNAVKQVEIDEQKELKPDEVLAILQKEAKKRRDTIDELTKAGRAEQADQESKELEILESFLPKQLSEDEIRSIAKAVIDRIGADGMGDMGKVMGALMPEVQGRSDGKLVSKIVRELLS